MPIALEITLILVLAALAAGLVPLLFQLRRTAQGLDAFLLSSAKDLAQIAGEIHASRLRVDHLTGSLQASVDELLSFLRVMGDAGRALRSYQARFSGTVASASQNLGGLIGGVSAVLALFKRSKTTHEPELEKRP
jgi:hypothetical protein